MGFSRNLRIALSAIYDKDARFKVMNKAGMCDDMPDEEYLRKLYKALMGKEINLDNPRSFNEKLQWLKLNNRKPEYTTMVDKCAVKKYVADKIGGEYVIPTLGVWDRFDDIDFSALPDKFVLKTTHDSGGVVVCNDKPNLNTNLAKKTIKRSMNTNFYLLCREWPYKNVKPRIIAEEYLENNEEGLHDYKVWCFHGVPKYIQYITGRVGGITKEAFYDPDWKMQDFSFHNPLMDEPIPKPLCLNELLSCASKLSNGIPFARCDFYILNNNSIKFGEITFFPMAGFETWKPEKMDYILGSFINLESDNDGK